jgi:hypothetical protein
LGRDFGAGSFVIAANHQIAAFLNESPFKLAVSLTGTFTFSSSKPIAAIALRTLVNERNEVLTTTVPLSTLGNGFGGTTLLVPYFAGGAGSGMQIVLLNPGDTPLSGKVQFFGQGSTNVSPQLVKVTVGGVLSATFNYTVPPRSAFRIATQQPRTGAQIGLARIVPALLGGTPSSLAIFSYQTGGITVSVASVPALPPAKASRMYIESSGIFGQLGSIQSGMTISNPAETVNVQLSVMNLDGTPTGLSTSMDLAAGAQIAKLGNELFPQLPSSFRGILRVNAPSPLVVVDFRGKYNERGDLLVTATPPYDESSAPLPEVYFPHFISGEGYSTQLILVSTGSAQTGSLQLVAQDGSVLPGTILQPVP